MLQEVETEVDSHPTRRGRGRGRDRGRRGRPRGLGRGRVRRIETVDINDVSENEDLIVTCTTVDTESDASIDSADDTVDDNLTTHGLKWTDIGEVTRDMDDRSHMNTKILWRDGLDNNRSADQYYISLYPMDCWSR